MYLEAQSFILDTPVVFLKDNLMCSDIEETIEKARTHFTATFKHRVYFHLMYLLDFSVLHKSEYIKFHSPSLVARLVMQFKMFDCEPTTNPLPSGLKMCYGANADFSYSTHYGALIEALLHLVNTVRRDILYAEGFISWYMHKPTVKERKTAKFVPTQGKYRSWHLL